MRINSRAELSRFGSRSIYKVCDFGQTVYLLLCLMMKYSLYGVVEKVTSEIRPKTVSVNFFLVKVMREGVGIPKIKL